MVRLKLITPRSDHATTRALTPWFQVPNPTYVPEWCQNIDTDDPDALIELWESKNVSGVLHHYTKGKEEEWLKNLAMDVLPDRGSVGHGGCGTIGGSCDFNLDCQSMVEQGKSAEYWILKAVEGKPHTATYPGRRTLTDHSLS